MPSAVTLQDVVTALGGELAGISTAEAGELRIEGLAPLPDAGPASIAFLANPRYRSQLPLSKAACVIVGTAFRDKAVARGAAIVSPDPYLYFARLTRWWAARGRSAPVAGSHPSAVVHPRARVAPSAAIGPLVVIEADVEIAEGAVVGAHCIVEAGASIGPQTRLAPHVTFGRGCSIGARGILHSGVVIGADGFGFAPDGAGRWEKIEQLGAVVLGDDVEIGANSCIDRGALGDTVIGHGVKIDNQVQIGHNVRIGDHSAIAGCVGIAGSAVVGRHCTLGGAAMIAGHLELADHVHISGGTVVSHSIRKPGTYTGVFPLDENVAWEKNAATLRQLHSLRDRIRTLEKIGGEQVGRAQASRHRVDPAPLDQAPTAQPPTAQIQPPQDNANPGAAPDTA